MCGQEGKARMHEKLEGEERRKKKEGRNEVEVEDQIIMSNEEGKRKANGS